MPRVVKAKTGAASTAIKKTTAKKKKLYSMPEKIAEGTVLTDMTKTQWRIGPTIGTGGFGEIYSACRVGEKSYEYVVKCEPHGNGPLFVEMHFYMRNAKLDDIKRFQKDRGLKYLGMPYMIGNGSEDINGQKHRFIVMPRYGSDVARPFLANGKRLPEGTAYRLSLQMIDVYEFVHNCGYVHADLKAANILLGYGKTGGSQAYLVDYGLASHFTTKEFKPDPKKMHNGTIEYTSRDAHQGVATMRADLEILGYNLIEWLGVELPWVKNNLLAVPVKVQKAKEEFMNNVATNLKSLFPQEVPVAIATYMMYVSKMDYNETPDYVKCRKIFANALRSMNISNSGDLEFKIKSTLPSKASKPNNAKAVQSNDSSMNVAYASDDDDDDVVFEQISPTKVITPRTLKTTHKTNVKKSSPKKTAPKWSPKKRMIGTTPPSKKFKTSADEASNSQTVSSRPTTRGATTTPLSATTDNLGSVSRSSRSGKTIINDSLTPNPRAGKTYEFNFELDVSLDANVVVNVKRKKRALPESALTSQPNKQRGESDSRATRVKVRKVANGENGSSNPRTAVTVKKSKR